MANRFQYLLLKRLLLGVLAILAVGLHATANAQSDDLDSEFFEIGFSTGILNIEDFGSEFTVGLNATFKATENFFLQVNYFQSDVARSDSEDTLLSDKRDLRHYNVLLGYNLFQGEVFRGKYSGLSSFYGVVGVGDTELLDEASFTWVYGLGYQMALTRRLMLNFDLRQYHYDFLITGQTENASTNTQFKLALGWLF